MATFDRVRRESGILWIAVANLFWTAEIFRGYRFRSRQAWGRQVVHRSQFQNASDRAYLGKDRIKARLIWDLDPQDWELPPNGSGCGGQLTSGMSSGSMITRKN
jgi:hypothetical protein